MTTYTPSRRVHPWRVGRPGIAGWDVDEVTVAALIAGDVTPAHPAEIREAVRILTRRGLSGREIALLIGVSSTTVHRHRVALRVTGGAI